MSRFTIILVGVTAPPLLTCGLSDLYIKAYVKNGPKCEHKQSIWNKDFSEENKQILIKNREPLVQAIRDLYEMKLKNMDLISTMFTENVIYEDPYVRCENKEIMLKSFSVNSSLCKAIEAEKFNVVHSQDSFHIFCNRKILNHKDRSFSLPSTILVKLTSENDEEKVASITDWWYDTKIIGPENSKWFGKFFNSYRISRLYVSTYYNIFRNFILNYITEIFD